IDEPVDPAFVVAVVVVRVRMIGRAHPRPVLAVHSANVTEQTILDRHAIGEAQCVGHGFPPAALSRSMPHMNRFAEPTLRRGRRAPFLLLVALTACGTLGMHMI